MMQLFEKLSHVKLWQDEFALLDLHSLLSTLPKEIPVGEMNALSTTPD